VEQTTSFSVFKIGKVEDYSWNTISIREGRRLCTNMQFLS